MEDEPFDEIMFEALANEQRRRVLHYLVEHESVAFDELVDVMAGWDAAASDDIADTDDRAILAARLHHAVLPKLDRLGFVEYEPVQADVCLRTGEVPVEAVEDRLRSELSKREEG